MEKKPNRSDAYGEESFASQANPSSDNVLNQASTHPSKPLDQASLPDLDPTTEIYRRAGKGASKPTGNPAASSAASGAVPASQIPPRDRGNAAAGTGQSGAPNRYGYQQAPYDSATRNNPPQRSYYASPQRPSDASAAPNARIPGHEQNLRAHQAYEARQAQMRQAYEARQRAQAQNQAQSQMPAAASPRQQGQVPMSGAPSGQAPAQAQGRTRAQGRAQAQPQGRAQASVPAPLQSPARGQASGDSQAQAQATSDYNGRQVAADATIAASVAATGTRSYGKASKKKDKKKRKNKVSESRSEGGAVAVAVRDERQQKSRLWTIVFWAAAAVLVLSLGALGYIGFSYWQGDNYYDSIENQAFADESTALSDVQGTRLADIRIDWDALRAINPDVVAWVYIPNTPVSYPVVWKEGDDDYYLHHNFSKEPASNFGAQYGAIMLSGKNNPNFTDQNNFFYGHNMANGSMFATFAHNIATETFNAQRDIYLFTPEGNYLLQSFALVRVHQSQIEVTTPNFADAVEFTTFVQNIIDTTLVDAQPPGPPAVDIDQTFAFSTCDGADNSYRLITFCSVAEYAPIGSQDDPTVDVLQDPNALDESTGEAGASGEGTEGGAGAEGTDAAAEPLAEGQEGAQDVQPTDEGNSAEPTDGAEAQPTEDQNAQAQEQG